MFGYVLADAQRLDAQAERRYRSAYCGLCHELSGRCGAMGRLLLSYDMAFLTLVLDSAYEPDIAHDERRCLMHPIVPRACAHGENTEYAADMTLILAYYKCLDDIRDDHSTLSRARLRLLKAPYEQAANRHGELVSAIERELAALAAIEQRNRPGCDTDEAAACFGRLLGGVFAKGEWGERLRPFGDALGRFVYIMDAWDDADADIRRGRYNPLKMEKDFERNAASLLKALGARFAVEFEKLPLEKDLPLIRNIVYSGVWTRYNLKTFGKKAVSAKRRRSGKGAAE